MAYELTALTARAQERDGWFSTTAYEQIKVVLRHKFFSLLEGYVPSQEECEALLQAHDESGKTKSGRPVPTSQSGKKRLRAGKHNMAKGALKPEDAAVRLQLELMHWIAGLMAWAIRRYGCRQRWRETQRR